MKRDRSLKRCIDCKGTFTKKELNKKGRCPDCGIKASLCASRQLRLKEGPFYESWKKGIKKAVKSL